ncbi:MAG TPA: aspartate aminotransferase family protein [Methylomirabilota bacterium]|nr:aspartate aminotransferase family protein [Methylomirabilota bacterium]
MKELARHIMVDFLPMKDFADDPLIVTEGRGIYLTDVDGKRYIDGLSGTFCVNLGHGNKGLAEAASRQYERLALAIPTLGTSDRALEMVKALLDLMPKAKQYTTVKLLSGGSEVTEAAIKMARQYHKQTGAATRYKVLSHYRAYHGATGHALAAGGWPGWRAAYEPLPGGFIHLHTPDPYRPPFPGPAETLGETYARLVEEVIELEGPETIAAFITEPIMMSAGVVVPPRDYLPRIRTLCDRYGILLIYDEIITGFGRTGTMFAAEHWDAWPDIFCLGKGMSGGYAPLSANVLTGRVAGAFWGKAAEAVQFHAGHTYGGNPVACAVGLAAIRQIVEERIVENAKARGAQAQARLRELQTRYPVIGDVRGEGLLLGVEFVEDAGRRRRFPPEEQFGLRVREAARRRGLLLRASHWMVAVAPPLTISAREMDEFLDILEAALREVVSGKG